MDEKAGIIYPLAMGLRPPYRFIPGLSAMRQTKWFFHPILIFIFSITAVALSLFLYIYWYVEVSTGLKRVLDKASLDRDQVLASQTWVVILVLSILVGILLMGIFTIFVYNQKTVDNFMVRLRKYFEPNPKKPIYFKSLRSVGYVFDHDPE
jgi:amino acid transporter